MNKQTEQDIEQLKQILDNSPDKNFYDLVVDITDRYFDAYGNLLNSYGFWGNSDDKPSYPRSLSDINTIIEQAERIAELEEEINEYEMAYEVILQMLNSCLPYIQKQSADLTSDIKLILGFTEPSELLEQRDLEMQAKGIEWIVNNVVPKNIILTQLWEQIHKLRKQGKGGDV